jgi:phosphoribosylaminoimidazole-succinocarboxamide synthase
MSTALLQTNFELPGQTGFYRGKVRDVYYLGDIVVMVASDRISAFDHILPKPIPHKGAVLNGVAQYFMNACAENVPHWMIASPDPNVTIGHRCEAFKVEMVIRGYLVGHAWREYKSGKRILCGVQMPEGMKENDPFPEPIITPTTKAPFGHDEDISKERILETGLVTPQDYTVLENYTRELFKKGTELAAERGLILADTKYEFGKKGDQICVIDEIHTPDSSRYFYLDGFKERQQKGERQKQLSKEFVREWLMAHGFQGLEGQNMPVMPDEFVEEVSERYIQLYELLTGKTFEKEEGGNIEERIYSRLIDYFHKSL